MAKQARCSESSNLMIFLSVLLQQQCTIVQAKVGWGPRSQVHQMWQPTALMDQLALTKDKTFIRIIFIYFEPEFDGDFKKGTYAQPKVFSDYGWDQNVFHKFLTNTLQ